jgi:hypothetical protein
MESGALYRWLLLFKDTLQESKSIATEVPDMHWCGVCMALMHVPMHFKSPRWLLIPGVMEVVGQQLLYLLFKKKKSRTYLAQMHFFFVVKGLEFRAYTLSHSTSPFLWWVFQDKVSQTIFLGWLQTTILLISASWVSRITCHWHLARCNFFLTIF